MKLNVGNNLDLKHREIITRIQSSKMLFNIQGKDS